MAAADGRELPGFYSYFGKKETTKKTTSSVSQQYNTKNDKSAKKSHDVDKLNTPKSHKDDKSKSNKSKSYKSDKSDKSKSDKESKPDKSSSSSKGKKSSSFSKSAPTSSPTSVEDVSCYSSSDEAVAIGTLVLTTLVTRIVREAQCHPAQIAAIMDEYFRPSTVLRHLDGTVELDGLDQVKRYYIGTDAAPGPFRLACSTHHLSYTAMDYKTHPLVQNEFVLGVNENIVDVTGGGGGGTSSSQGRYFCMELFSGPGDSFLEGTGLCGNNGNNSNQQVACSLPPQCQRPQIYSIVMHPTFV